MNKTGSEMTLNYWMMVEIYPNIKEEVGSSIPNCDISSLLDKKLAKWSAASRALALALACRPSISRKKEKLMLNKTLKWAPKSMKQMAMASDWIR